MVTCNIILILVLLLLIVIHNAVDMTSRCELTNIDVALTRCRERGEEAVFMRKEDKKLLENLLKKEKAAHGKE